MIHVFVGTKAQLIKMAPIMQELDRQAVAYNFINAGQHAALLEELVQQFHLREPDVLLRKERSNINTPFEAASWMIRNLGQLAFRRAWTCQKVFGGQEGICLIHGDTLTTLLSLLYAKRCRQKVAHVEAGLRSYHLLDPFPEELIRLFAMRHSDLLFAPSEWAFENLCRMGYSAKAVYAGGNTGLDAVRYALQCAGGRNRPEEPYAAPAPPQSPGTVGSTERSVSVESLRAGMRLSQSLYDGRGVLLLAANTTITSRFIALLRQRNLASIALRDASGESCPAVAAEQQHTLTDLLDARLGELTRERCEPSDVAWHSRQILAPGDVKACAAEKLRSYEHAVGSFELAAQQLLQGSGVAFNGVSECGYIALYRQYLNVDLVVLQWL